MPLSSAEQQIIEDMVAAASPDQRDNMRLDAEAALRQINNLMARRLLSQEENKVAERAIEILGRLEAIGTGKAAPQPFSAPVKNEVNDDAVKLKTLTNLTAAKYLPMSDEELKAALPLDFPSDHYGFEFDNATFVLVDMIFTLSKATGSQNLTVVGRGKYAGFKLFVSGDRRSWKCSASDGTIIAATREAKKTRSVNGREVRHQGHDAALECLTRGHPQITHLWERLLCFAADGGNPMSASLRVSRGLSSVTWA